MIALVTIFLFFIVYLLVTILERVDERANELQLSLDGIKDRIYHLEKANRRNLK